MTATTSTPRQTIRPSTDLKTVIPSHMRRRVWSRLQQDVSGRLRGLRLPYGLGPIIAWLCVVMGVAGTAIIVPHVGIGNAIVLGMTATLGTLLLFQFASRPLAVAFPQGVVTVGDLAVAALPPGFEDAAKQQMTDQEVWEKLRQIVADCIGIKIEKVTPSARFVEDLGAG